MINEGKEPKQPQHPIERIAKIAARVTSIENIVQTSGAFSVNLEEAKGARFVVTTFARPALTVMLGSNVTVTLGYKFEAAPGGDADTEAEAEAESESEAPVDRPKPAIRVEATFVVTYGFSGEAPLSDEELRVFGEINGNLNATAYWREYLNACLSRASLPPFIVPPFNAAQRIKQIKQEAKEAAANSGTELAEPDQRA